MEFVSELKALESPGRLKGQNINPQENVIVDILSKAGLYYKNNIFGEAIRYYLRAYEQLKRSGQTLSKTKVL